MARSDAIMQESLESKKKGDIAFRSQRISDCNWKRVNFPVLHIVLCLQAASVFTLEMNNKAQVALEGERMPTSGH